MLLIVTIITIFIGAVLSREPNIDINRVRIVPQETYHSEQPNWHERRSIPGGYEFRTTDYEGHSSRYLELHAPPSHASSTKAPVKVYEPREDPRLFYQSDAYLKGSPNGQNVNQEVSFIYPGRDLHQGGDRRISMGLRQKNRVDNMIPEGSSICVRCPHDRTIIARAGSDRVLFQTPRLYLCSGLAAPRSYRFVQMYGPKLGSIIEHGSHMIIGRIMYKNRSVHLCKMQVHVVTQGCITPKNLVSHCQGQNGPCNFTCLDPKQELRGHSTLTCGGDMKWKGILPICNARHCDALPPPDHGRIFCKASTELGYSKCRVRCSHGWRGYPRAISVCRHGAWTNTLTCQKIQQYRNS